MYHIWLIQCQIQLRRGAKASQGGPLGHVPAVPGCLEPVGHGRSFVLNSLNLGEHALGAVPSGLRFRRCRFLDVSRGKIGFVNPARLQPCLYDK
jgi:hypothetical protein